MFFIFKISSSEIELTYSLIEIGLHLRCNKKFKKYFLREGKTMKKLAITSALLSALAVAGTANAYQAEVGLSAGLTDPDHGSTTGLYGVNGTAYFKPVQVRNAPLAEAAYLDRASNVKAQYSYSKVDDAKLHDYSLGAEYFIPNSDFYASAEIGRKDIKLKHASNLNTTTYAAEVGYLPIPGMLIAVGAKGFDNDDISRTSPSLRAKYVTEISNGQDVNFEAGATFGKTREYNVAADYYLDKTLSLGADFYKNNSLDNREYGIKANKFFNQQVSLEGRVGFGKLYNNDYTSYGVAAKYRF